MNPITTRLNVDNLLLQALREDISDEDVTTNAVMRTYKKGECQLICKRGWDHCRNGYFPEGI